MAVKSSTIFAKFAAIVSIMAVLTFNFWTESAYAKGEDSLEVALDEESEISMNEIEQLVVDDEGSVDLVENTKSGATSQSDPHVETSNIPEGKQTIPIDINRYNNVLKAEKAYQAALESGDKKQMKEAKIIFENTKAEYIKYAAVVKATKSGNSDELNAARNEHMDAHNKLKINKLEADLQEAKLKKNETQKEFISVFKTNLIANPEIAQNDGQYTDLGIVAARTKNMNAEMVVATAELNLANSTGDQVSADKANKRIKEINDQNIYYKEIAKLIKSEASKMEVSQYNKSYTDKKIGISTANTEGTTLQIATFGKGMVNAPNNIKIINDHVVVTPSSNEKVVVNGTEITTPISLDPGTSSIYSAGNTLYIKTPSDNSGIVYAKNPDSTSTALVVTGQTAPVSAPIVISPAAHQETGLVVANPTQGVFDVIPDPKMIYYIDNKLVNMPMKGVVGSYIIDGNIIKITTAKAVDNSNGVVLHNKPTKLETSSAADAPRGMVIYTGESKVQPISKIRNELGTSPNPKAQSQLNSIKVVKTIPSSKSLGDAKVSNKALSLDVSGEYVMVPPIQPTSAPTLKPVESKRYSTTGEGPYAGGLGVKPVKEPKPMTESEKKTKAAEDAYNARDLSTVGVRVVKPVTPVEPSNAPTPTPGPAPKPDKPSSGKPNDTENGQKNANNKQNNSPAGPTNTTVSSKNSTNPVKARHPDPVWYQRMMLWDRSK